MVIIDLDSLGFYCVYDDSWDEEKEVWYKNVDFFAIKNGLDTKVNKQEQQP